MTNIPKKKPEEHDRMCGNCKFHLLKNRGQKNPWVCTSEEVSQEKKDKITYTTEACKNWRWI